METTKYNASPWVHLYYILFLTLIQVILFIKLHFMKFLLKETIILFENKRLCDKISFSGDKMKKQYLIYADESHRKGKFFSNFYGAH